MNHVESPDFDQMAEARQILKEAHEDREEIKRLRLENWQLKGALGYPVPSDIPEGPFKCGLCEARRQKQYPDEIERLRTVRDAARALVQECQGDLPPSLGALAKLESAVFLDWNRSQ